MDFVTKIEKDLVKLAFLAIKGKSIKMIIFENLKIFEGERGGRNDK